MDRMTATTTATADRMDRITADGQDDGNDNGNDNGDGRQDGQDNGGWTG
jgi:hypothetical protein